MHPDDQFQPIETERLLLRRSKPDDAETISAYRSDPEVHRYQGWERTDPAGVRDEIEQMSSRSPGLARAMARDRARPAVRRHNSTCHAELGFSIHLDIGCVARG